MKSFYQKYKTAAGNLYAEDSWTESQIAAVEADLKQAGVKYCVGNYVDLHGVPKGKVVPLSHFSEFARGSELYTGYALDGLGQRPNDDEIASVPDLGLIIPLPWNTEMAWLPADNTLHGQPYEVNARVLLQKVLREAESMGSWHESWHRRRDLRRAPDCGRWHRDTK